MQWRMKYGLTVRGTEHKQTTFEQREVSTTEWREHTAYACVLSDSSTSAFEEYLREVV